MRRIGLVCVAILIALGSMGAGVAYFSDTAVEAATFNAGDMHLQISPDQTTWYGSPDMSWSIGPDWAPGDITEVVTYARNAGTTGGQIYLLKVVPEDYSGSRPLLDNIYITGLKFTWGGRTTEIDIWASYVTLYDADNDGKVTLGEFMDSPYGPAIYLDYGGTADILGPGGADVDTTTLALKFNPDAGNDLMNKTSTINLTFKLFDGWDNVHHLGEVSPQSYGYE